MKQWKNAIFLISFLILPHSFAENTGQHTGQGAAATTDGRPAAPNNFNTKDPHNELKVLTENFGLSEQFVIRKWGVDGPAALDAIKDTDMNKRDESKVSKMMAFFFGTRDNDQVRELIPKFQSLKDAASKPAAGEQVDNRYLEETKRLFWAAKYIEGEPVKTDEAEAFYKFFREDLKTQLAQNEDLKKKIQDNIAGGGNKDGVKDEVRKMVNQEALKGWLDSMMASKDPKSKKFAAELADTVSFKDGNGNKFLDMIGPKGEKQRLHLGKNTTDVEKSLAGAVGKLAGSSLSPFIQTPDAGQEWFVGGDGKYTPGAPTGFTAPAPTAPAPTPKAVADAANPPKRDGAATTPPTPGVKPTKQQVETTFNANCLDCHNAGEKKLTPTADGFQNAAGAVIKFSDAAGKIRATTRMSMAVPENVIAQIEAWGKTQ